MTVYAEHFNNDSETAHLKPWEEKLMTEAGFALLICLSITSAAQLERLQSCNTPGEFYRKLPFHITFVFNLRGSKGSISFHNVCFHNIVVQYLKKKERHNNRTVLDFCLYQKLQKYVWGNKSDSAWFQYGCFHTSKFDLPQYSRYPDLKS